MLNIMRDQIDPPDWAAELIAVGVLQPTSQIDDNGSPVYSLNESAFPSGPRGARLRKLFDQNVRQVSNG
jgi:hypothetical protein